jgi:ribose transport system ATP-binding protein
MSNDAVLQTVGICKAFPGVQALQDISLELLRGEVHALVGENGAGKSTLMKIFGGLHKQDKGEVRIDGGLAEINEPKDSLKFGISIVYQELNLVPTLSAAENILLNAEQVFKPIGFLNRKSMFDIAQGYLDMLSNAKINAKKKVMELTIAQQQIVEIAHAVKQNAKIMIFDEPTAILGQEDTKLLFQVIRNLKSKGISIFYISHRLDEIFQICDRVSVLRDGELVGTLDLQSKKATKIDLIKMMIGREIGHIYKDGGKTIANNEYVLEVDNLSRDREFENISFKLKRGEILGFSGLVGAGRTEVMRAILGVTKLKTGTIRIFGKSHASQSVKKTMEAGIVLVPEDRKKEGLVLIESLKNNVALSTLRKFSRFGFINKGKQERAVQEYVAQLNIRPPLVERKVKDFSGGNQQKIVLAKCLLSNPKIFILDEPTRGIDVGAKEEIYEIINGLAKSGQSIILVSSEMEELIGLCDRIIVMHEGRIKAEIDSKDATQELILRKASGMD